MRVKRKILHIMEIITSDEEKFANVSISNNIETHYTTDLTHYVIRQTHYVIGQNHYFIRQDHYVIEKKNFFFDPRTLIQSVFDLFTS